MKFIQFYKNGGPALGAESGRGFVDVASIDASMPSTLLELVQNGYRADELSKYLSKAPIIDESNITYAPVIQGMEKIICVGLNYSDHAKECNAELPVDPTIFCKFANAIAAHKQDIVLPKNAHTFDYEAELVIIAGPNGSIWGYTIGNDLSIREWQKKTSQWLLGKTYDSFAPIGPVAVDADSIDADNLGVMTRVNGEVRQNSSTNKMIFSCRQLVDYINNYIPLKAGDIIFTGTPHGVAMGYPAEADAWLKSGDVVEVEIENIGILCNQFV